MRYSLEPRDRIYVKGYGFMSFAKSMSNKYGTKPVDTAKKSATDAGKTVIIIIFLRKSLITIVIIMMMQI